jgi:hypothetical protein
VRDVIKWALHILDDICVVKVVIGSEESTHCASGIPALAVSLE